MIVTVVGAGNGGYSHCCKLTENGHAVRLLKTSKVSHEESFQVIEKSGGIHYVDDTQGKNEGFAKLDLITRDEKEAIHGADLVFVVTQALQHKACADRIAPLLESGQMLIVSPGYLGSVYFRQKCRSKNVLFAEGESLPFDARIIRPGVVNILFQNVRNPLAFMPASESETGLRRSSMLLDRFTKRQSILESAFHNPNLIVHTVGTIMSAARIEHSHGEFWMYREAFTESTWNLIRDLDAEKMAILAAFGLPEQSFAHSFQFRTYQDISCDPLEAFQHYAQHGSPKGPDVVNHRYIYEDVPMGLCLMSSIGQKLGISTPVCDSLVNIAGSLLQKDFWKEGRTLESLGLNTLSKSEIVDYLTT